jgi:hypothetical protein
MLNSQIITTLQNAFRGEVGIEVDLASTLVADWEGVHVTVNNLTFVIYPAGNGSSVWLQDFMDDEGNVDCIEHANVYVAMTAVIGQALQANSLK